MTKNEQVLTIKKLAEQLDAEIIGNPDLNITGVNAINQAESDQVTFLSSKKLSGQLPDSRAAAVITSQKIDTEKTQLIVKNVDLALIKTLNTFGPKLTITQGTHPSAQVHPSAKIAESASIGPHVSIEPDAKIGQGSVISAGARIGQNVTIGQNTQIGPNVVIMHKCRIGNNCIIQANSTIGSVGFGYKFINDRHHLIPHNGSVIIEDAVDIGANCAIDRSKFGATVVGAGTKMDNFVHIAHNVSIGKCCLMAACVAVSGSCKIGNGVIMGGQVGLAEGLTIGDGAMIGAQSGLAQDVKPNSKIIGSPPNEVRQQFKIFALLKKLPDMYNKLKKIDRKVSKLEASENN
jgi:UDP-3-O-[3-hydroxymyristoyl] glucosamine N-acyltransferase